MTTPLPPPKKSNKYEWARRRAPNSFRISTQTGGDTNLEEAYNNSEQHFDSTITITSNKYNEQHHTTPFTIAPARTSRSYNITTSLPRRPLSQTQLSISLPAYRHLRPIKSVLARVPTQARARAAATELYTPDRCRLLCFRGGRSEEDHGEEEGSLGL